MLDPVHFCHVHRGRHLFWFLLVLDAILTTLALYIYQQISLIVHKFKIDKYFMSLNAAKNTIHKYWKSIDTCFLAKTDDAWIQSHCFRSWSCGSHTCSADNFPRRNNKKQFYKMRAIFCYYCIANLSNEGRKVLVLEVVGENVLGEFVDVFDDKWLSVATPAHCILAIFVLKKG